MGVGPFVFLLLIRKPLRLPVPWQYNLLLLAKTSKKRMSFILACKKVIDINDVVSLDGNASKRDERYCQRMECMAITYDMAPWNQAGKKPTSLSPRDVVSHGRQGTVCSFSSVQSCRMVRVFFFFSFFFS